MQAVSLCSPAAMLIIQSALSNTEDYVSSVAVTITSLDVFFKISQVWPSRDSEVALKSIFYSISSV